MTASGQARFEANKPSYGRALGTPAAAQHPEEAIGRRRGVPPGQGNDIVTACNPSGLTPALDRLAERGLRFDAAYTPVPMTLPAHASILTGLEPFSHGIRNNTAFRLGETPTLATLLKRAGYRTGAFVGAVVIAVALQLLSTRRPLA